MPRTCSIHLAGGEGQTVAIITQCPECGKKLKASEAQIGKKAKCPQCQKPFEIQAIESPQEQAVAAAPTAKKQPAPKPAAKQAPAPVPKRPSGSGVGGSAVQPREDWYLQTADGEEYGPVSRSELDEWRTEGRVDSECQLLREGWDQWKWAEEVFPDIAGGAAAGGASDDNPFAGLGESTPAATTAADPFTGVAAQAPAAESNPYAAPSANAAAPGVVPSGGVGAITPTMALAMRQTKPWIMLFMILGGLGSAGASLLVLFSLFMMTQSIIGGLVLVLISGIYLAVIGYITFLLYKYFDALNKFERTTDGPHLETALIAQKNFWKFYGILILVAIVLNIVGSIVVPMMLAAAGIAAGAAGGGGF